MKNNPVNLVDPTGLAQKPGCDGIPDWLETFCIRKCCDRHDEVYKNKKYQCKAESWYKPWCYSPRCALANAEVSCSRTLSELYESRIVENS